GPLGSDLIVHEGGKTYHVVCHEEGPIPHPGNVHKYIICSKSGSLWYITVMPCSIGTKFDPISRNCVLDN
uniref:Blo 1 12 n=1 Tax=Blomia tropicalis TaxID=40697 RepID=UPI0005322FAE|nr:Chain A, Blo 1 12 [Blomia tropicalis]